MADIVQKKQQQYTILRAQRNIIVPERDTGPGNSCMAKLSEVLNYIQEEFLGALQNVQLYQLRVKDWV